MAAAQIDQHPRYEADEPCSHLEGVGVGLQVILLMVPGKVLFVALILGAEASPNLICHGRFS